MPSLLAVERPRRSRGLPQTRRVSHNPSGLLSRTLARETLGFQNLEGLFQRSTYSAGSTRVAMRQGSAVYFACGKVYLHADRFAWAAPP